MSSRKALFFPAARTNIIFGDQIHEMSTRFTTMHARARAADGIRDQLFSGDELTDDDMGFIFVCGGYG